VAEHETSVKPFTNPLRDSEKGDSVVSVPISSVLRPLPPIDERQKKVETGQVGRHRYSISKTAVPPAVMGATYHSCRSSSRRSRGSLVDTSRHGGITP